MHDRQREREVGRSRELIPKPHRGHERAMQVVLEAGAAARRVGYVDGRGRGAARAQGWHAGLLAWTSNGVAVVRAGADADAGRGARR